MDFPCWQIHDWQKPPQELLKHYLHVRIPTFIANVVAYGVQFKDEPNGVFLDHHPAFIDLCESSNKDGTILVFVHPSNSLLLNSIVFYVPLQSNQEVATMFNVFFFSVIDYLKLMYFAPPTTFELRKFNYNTLHIEKGYLHSTNI